MSSDSSSIVIIFTLIQRDQPVCQVRIITDGRSRSSVSSWAGPAWKDWNFDDTRDVWLTTALVTCRVSSRRCTCCSRYLLSLLLLLSWNGDIREPESTTKLWRHIVTWLMKPTISATLHSCSSDAAVVTLIQCIKFKYKTISRRQAGRRMLPPWRGRTDARTDGQIVKNNAVATLRWAARA